MRGPHIARIVIEVPLDTDWWSAEQHVGTHPDSVTYLREWWKAKVTEVTVYQEKREDT